MLAEVAGSVPRPGAATGAGVRKNRFELGRRRMASITGLGLESNQRLGLGAAAVPAVSVS